MTVTIANIGWGSYASFEGPFFGGKQRYVLPNDPTENDRIMNVVTAPEGGAYDAINMYDAGIVSVGLIQWINAGQHSVDAMLGRVIEDHGEDKVFLPLADVMKQCNATFKKNASGAWRFFQDNVEVASDAQQRKLFMLGAGTKGSYTPAAKTLAKTWAMGFANVFADPDAQRAQVDYTVPRLKEFLQADVRSAMYDGQPDEGWIAAASAAVISFAVNVPAMTARAYRSYVPGKDVKWSPDWVIGLLKHITFNGPSTGIWLKRYNEIRPVLEKLYAVKLPRTSIELSAWRPAGASLPSTISDVKQPVVVENVPPIDTTTTGPVSVDELPAPVHSTDEQPTPQGVVPAWKSIFDFIMMIIGLIFGKK